MRLLLAAPERMHRRASPDWLAIELTVMQASRELQGGQDLFWRTCPVLVRRGDNGDERAQALTIRLIASGQKAGQRVRSLVC